RPAPPPAPDAAAARRAEVDRLTVRAIQLVKVQDYAAAVELMSQAAAIAPDDVGVFINRANFRAMSGDQAGALADADRAIALAPGDARAWLARAGPRIRTDPAAARADLDRALELAPNMR